jgi:glycosyltransferase involved in cell wall biosynthesis
MTVTNNRTIQLLLITHYYPNHRGGVEIVAGKLAEYLLKLGSIQITWLASNIDLPPPEIPGLQCFPMPSSNLIEDKLQIPYPLWTIPSFYHLWKMIEKADIIHIHDYLYLSNLAAFLFAKIQKKPIIITQHIGFIPYNNFFFRWLLTFLNSTLGSLTLGNAEQTIFISEVVQKYFAQKTSFCYPSLLFPNGVETEKYFPTNEIERIDNRQKLGLPLDKISFLFVGRFVEKKGLLILHKLVKKFPSIHWIFVGWGPIDPTEWQLPNVKVFHNLQSTELTPIYQAADLLVLPSKGEGFPLVVQEAMACGTPVLVGSETARDCLGAGSLIFTEIVECENAVVLWSKTIEKILVNPTKLTAIRKDLAIFAQKYWNWQQTATQYYKILENIVSEK